MGRGGWGTRAVCSSQPKLAQAPPVPPLLEVFCWFPTDIKTTSTLLHLAHKLPVPDPPAPPLPLGHLSAPLPCCNPVPLDLSVRPPERASPPFPSGGSDPVCSTSLTHQGATAWASASLYLPAVSSPFPFLSLPSAQGPAQTTSQGVFGSERMAQWNGPRLPM